MNRGARLRNAAILAVLAVLAGVTWLLSRPPTPAAAPERARDERPLGYYLRGARFTGTDEQGRVAYRILAERLDELPNEERLDLAGVRIDYTPPDETPWQISAAVATGPKDRSRLDLRGSVEVTSAPTDGSEPVAITTETLRFEPATSSAESDAAVSIRVGDWRLEAKGLRTHLKGNTLRLESEVHGTFAP